MLFKVYSILTSKKVDAVQSVAKKKKTNSLFSSLSGQPKQSERQKRGEREELN